MSEQFIETDGGLINMRFVRRIRVGKIDQKNVAYTDDGGEYKFWAPAEALENLRCQIVPASPGEYATAISVDDDGQDLTEENVLVREFSIIAWRVNSFFPWDPTPVFKESACSNEMILHKEKDGTFVAPGLFQYSSIKEAKAAVLRDTIDARLHAAAKRAKEKEQEQPND
jgi:hypothetical protein